MSEQHILVIDDEASVRDAFFMALEDTNYAVATADCGEKGIAQFNQQEYSLVFLDLKMPGLNGVETLRELRKVNKAVPIYFVTAFSREFMSDLLKAKSEGLSFEILQKPLGASQIVEVSDSILQLQQSKLELTETIQLKIYVAGLSPTTQAAIIKFKDELKKHISTHITTMVVDLLEHPELAQEDDIIATPTIVRELPAPATKLIYDLNNHSNISIVVDKIHQ